MSQIVDQPQSLTHINFIPKPHLSLIPQSQTPPESREPFVIRQPALHVLSRGFNNGDSSRAEYIMTFPKLNWDWTSQHQITHDYTGYINYYWRVINRFRQLSVLVGKQNLDYFFFSNAIKEPFFVPQRTFQLTVHKIFF